MKDWCFDENFVKQKADKIKDYGYIIQKYINPDTKVRKVGVFKRGYDLNGYNIALGYYFDWNKPKVNCTIVNYSGDFVAFRLEERKLGLKVTGSTSKYIDKDFLLKRTRLTSQVSFKFDGQHNIPYIIESLTKYLGDFIYKIEQETKNVYRIYISGYEEMEVLKICNSISGNCAILDRGRILE